MEQDTSTQDSVVSIAVFSHFPFFYRDNQPCQGWDQYHSHWDNCRNGIQPVPQSQYNTDSKPINNGNELSHKCLFKSECCRYAHGSPTGCVVWVSVCMCGLARTFPSSSRSPPILRIHTAECYTVDGVVSPEKQSTRTGRERGRETGVVDRRRTL